MPLPNLIIAGPPKTGTTSVFDWLSKHPDVCASNVKETYYFYNYPEIDAYPNFNKDGWSKYEGLFSDWRNEKVIFEASPGYIYSDLAAQELKKIDGVKIIFIHRSPETRAMSEYKFRKFKTKDTDLTIEEYFGLKNGELTNELQLQRGRYKEHLDRWTKHFDRQQLGLFRFDELKNDPLGFMVKVCEYLDIDLDFYSNFNFSAKNQTANVRSKTLHTFSLNLKRKLKIKNLGFLSDLYMKINTQKLPESDEREKHMLALLKAYFAPHEAALNENYSDLFI